MSNTEATTPTPAEIERRDKVSGLRRLADFLHKHPEVPVPDLDTIWLTRAGAADFVSGLNELPVDGVLRGSNSHVRLVRQFDGITLKAYADKDHVGVSTFEPWHPDRICLEAVKAAEEGDPSEADLL